MCYGDGGSKNKDKTIITIMSIPISIIIGTSIITNKGAGAGAHPWAISSVLVRRLRPEQAGGPVIDGVDDRPVGDALLPDGIFLVRACLLVAHFPQSLAHPYQTRFTGTNWNVTAGLVQSRWTFWSALTALPLLGPRHMRLASW